ncbi:MAG TPA: response regulator transcription factor [Candidatus Acidoferrum sp.]|nr:response regulator transcription factor [Candidatus Acidoferrum sp.]
MRVLVADDHAVFRRGLKETLAEAFSAVVFGEARTAQEALDHVRRQNWDVVILDISMPGKSGLDILDELKRLRPKLPILLLSMHPEQQFARRALKAGAAGYLTKDGVPEELKKAVKKIVGGGRYVSATLAEKLAVDLREGSDLPLHELLSDREFQVLRMIASGKTVKEIAEELSLSVKTVSTYRARILEKSGMKTNAELIRYALQAELVD